MPTFDPAVLRPQFPALAAEQDGRPVVFLDGPGGTQVPQRVIDAVGGYYRESNANHGGAFATSVRSDAILRGGPRRRGRPPRRGLAGRGQVRPEHDVAHVRPLAVDRAGAAARATRS